MLSNPLTEVEQRIFDRVMKEKPDSNPELLKKYIKTRKRLLNCLRKWSGIANDEAVSCL